MCLPVPDALHSSGARTHATAPVSARAGDGGDRRHTGAAVRPAFVRNASLLIVLAVVGCTDTDGVSSEASASAAGDAEPGTAGPATTSAAETRRDGSSSHSRPAEPARPRTAIRFRSVTAASGIDFVHVSGDSAEKPFPAANGSGIALFDLDQDGAGDLLFLNGTSFPVAESAQDPDGPSDEAYRRKPGGQYAKVTALAGLGHRGYSAGVAVSDVDGDGFPDVFVNCFGPDVLYRNQGDGTFRRCETAAGISDPAWGTSAAFLDFNADGLPDLYVCNYAEWSLDTNAFCGNRAAHVRIFCAPSSVRPVPDRLYENLGDGRFVDALESAGLARDPGRGQGVIVADLDGDGDSDLYVANDASPNFLFRREPDGRFRDWTDLSGAAHDFEGRAQAGMGVTAGDVDRNGTIELFVTNYEDEHNVLYESRQPGFFNDVSHAAGLAAPSLRWVGWGTAFTDLNLDGWPDLVIVNGHTDDNLADMGRDAPYEQPPLLFENRAGRLSPVQPDGGDYFHERHCARSLVTGDPDGDLDTDLIIGHQDGPPAVLINETPRMTETRALRVRLISTSATRDAVGASLQLTAGGQTARAEVRAGGSYLAASAPELVLAVPTADAGRLQIRWPLGNVEHWDVPLTSGPVTVVEGRGPYPTRLPQN